MNAEIHERLKIHELLIEVLAYLTDETANEEALSLAKGILQASSESLWAEVESLVSWAIALVQIGNELDYNPSDDDAFFLEQLYTLDQLLEETLAGEQLPEIEGMLVTIQEGSGYQEHFPLLDFAYANGNDRYVMGQLHKAFSEAVFAYGEGMQPEDMALEGFHVELDRGTAGGLCHMAVW